MLKRSIELISDGTFRYKGYALSLSSQGCRFLLLTHPSEVALAGSLVEALDVIDYDLETSRKAKEEASEFTEDAWGNVYWKCCGIQASSYTSVDRATHEQKECPTKKRERKAEVIRKQLQANGC